MNNGCRERVCVCVWMDGFCNSERTGTHLRRGWGGGGGAKSLSCYRPPLSRYSPALAGVHTSVMDSRAAHDRMGDGSGCRSAVTPGPPPHPLTIRQRDAPPHPPLQRHHRAPFALVNVNIFPIWSPGFLRSTADRGGGGGGGGLFFSDLNPGEVEDPAFFSP